MLKKFLIGTVVALALLVGVTASAADYGTVTLKVGSTGPAVVALQTLVGALPIDGSFGPITKAKVMIWQQANGLTADGLFGNLSKAKANLVTTTTTTTTTTTGSTTFTLGGEGETSAFDINQEDDALASSDDQHVATIEFDVEDGDVMLQKVDLYFEEATVSNDLWDNIKSIKLVSEGKTISDVDVSDDNDWKDEDDGIYSIGLSGTTVFKDGDSAEIEVMIETTDKVETDDAAEQYNLWAELRFANSAGVLTYEGGDEGEDDDAISFKIEALDAFYLSFDENNSSPDTDETLDLSSASTETLVIVDVEVGEEQGGTLQEAKVTLTAELATDETATDADDLIDEVEFYVDGKKIDSDSVDTPITDGATSLVYTFDLDDMDVDAEDELKIEVKASFNDIEDDSAFVGATVKVASIVIDGEDQAGEDFDTTETDETTSYAPIFSVTAGAIDVTWTEEPEAFAGATENTGTIVFTVRIENNTGSALASMDTTGAWEFEVKGYGTVTETSVAGDADLADGDDAEYVVTLAYASKSTAAFTVEVVEVAGIPVASVWKD